jgi:PAS domain S-box-containing protein/putative nucleotidyltransferase with HDIG domain
MNDLAALPELHDERKTRQAMLHMLEDLQRERNEIRSARERWLQTVDALDTPLVVVDAQLRVVRANRAYADKAGLGVREVNGKPYLECFPRLADPTLPMPERFELPCGEAYRVRSFPVSDGTPDRGEWLHLFEDVTAATRADAQARTVLDISASEDILKGDVEAVARQMTEVAARATGVARANVWLFSEAEDELRCIDLYEAASGRHSSGMVLTEQQFANEFRALKSAPYVDASDPLSDPRTTGYVESYLKPLGITSMLDTVVQISGKHIGLLCLEHVRQPHKWLPDEIAFAARLADKVAVAVTNRGKRRAEDALRTSERRFRTMFERSPVGITECSIEGRYLAANPSFCRMVGYSRDELCARSFRDITHPEDLAADEAGLAAVLADTQGHHAKEKRYIHKDGGLIWASLLVTPVYGRDGAIEYLFTMVQDITARKEAESDRQRADQKLRRSLESTIAVIAATMESRDPYTAGHQRRVADLAAAIAREMGLGDHVVQGIHFGALIHDLGKIQVPSELLSKPTKLSKLEFELIKTHPQTGYEILQGIEFPWPVADMVRQHHERLDGSGYPQGLKGEAIRLEARVLAVADVVEAMASHRPYRAGLGIEAALKEIEAKRGIWFEPAAVDACLRLFREKRFTLDLA